MTSHSQAVWCMCVYWWIMLSLWPLLHNEVDVPEGHVLHLGLAGEQRHERRRELLQQGVVIVRVLRQQLQKLHQDLDGWQHDSWVGMRETWGHTLTDAIVMGKMQGRIFGSARQLTFNSLKLVFTYTYSLFFHNVNAMLVQNTLFSP